MSTGFDFQALSILGSDGHVTRRRNDAECGAGGQVELCAHGCVQFTAFEGSGERCLGRPVPGLRVVEPSFHVRFGFRLIDLRSLLPYDPAQGMTGAPPWHWWSHTGDSAHRNLKGAGHEDRRG